MFGNFSKCEQILMNMLTDAEFGGDQWVCHGQKGTND